MKKLLRKLYEREVFKKCLVSTLLYRTLLFLISLFSRPNKFDDFTVWQIQMEEYVEFLHLSNRISKRTNA